MHAVRALMLAFTGLCAVAAGSAHAAPVPAPGLKVLAITAPTHLPPRQSEVQRVTVESEGGSFTLSSQEEGKGTPVVTGGHLTFTEGSAAARIESIESGASFEVGDRVTFPEEYEYEVEKTVVSCSADCKTPGSTVTFSEAATQTVTDAAVQIFTKELSGVTGSFHIGEEIQGTLYPYFPADTVVTAVGPGTLTLSKSTGFEYVSYEGVIGIGATALSAPIAYNASAEAVQSALQAVFGPGSVSVSGGPGGTTESPYFVTFGGSFADQDVKQMTADSSGLTGEHPFAHVFTTVPGGVGTGEIVVLAANVGGVPSSGTITAKVGPLPEGIVSTGKGVGTEWHCPGGAGETTITCTSGEPLRALHSTPNALNIPVEVGSAAASNATVPVELSGGGSSEASTYQLPIVVSQEPASFGVAGAWAGSFEADGSSSTQAGGHPYDSAAYAMVNSVRLGNGAISPAGDSKNVVVDLPPGFVGNPLAGPRCPQSVVIEPEHGSSALCNQSETVGNLDPYIGELKETLKFSSRLFNDIPPKGSAAEFTTKLGPPFQSIVANVNSEEDFGVRLTAPNNPNYDKIYGFFAAFEGVPVHGNGQAFITNPVNCAESAERAPVVKAMADTFQEPGSYPELTVPQPALQGCQNLQFKAFDPNTNEGQVSFSFQPTSTAGSSPVGATAHLHVDQSGLTDPDRLATPELKRAVIKLPAGLSLNPSAANGLESCSEAQIGYLGKSFPMPNPIRFNEAQPTCPDGSKLGTAEIKTPLLENSLVGTVYLANQEENPYGSLLAIYFVVNDPLTGVLVKIPGEVQADPVTGRLTAVFDDNPQLPFDDLILDFRGGGPRSEFATSEVCGDYSTEGEWTPWSAPESGPPAMTSASFSVVTGCSSSLAARPFSPSFQAGIAATQAGGYGPLVINVNRKDGEQELASLNFRLPAGVIGKLAGIPHCPDAAIAEAAVKTGRGELANPSCPAGSLLGSVDAAAGVGSEPVHVAGQVYLAGAYKGAPISSVAIIPAVAGPFDLGDVVVRAPIYINPETAALTVKTDPIPTILKGIPLKVQSVALNIDRPGFTLNPTNCNVKSASAAIAGNSGATATPTARFQVGGCAGLAFKPKLGAATSGKTSKANGASLHVTLVPPHQGPESSAQAEEANIARVKVDLPKQLPSRLTTLQKACTSAQFDANPSGCPAASIVGTAVARTPLLASPLTGPAYFVSRGNEAFPQLVLVLQGEEITVELVGDTFISKAGITSSTFASVPDVPVTSFELTLPEGKYSALAANANLCSQKLAMPTEFAAQNGTVLKQFTPITVEGCPNTISITSHTLRGRNLTVSVSVPAAGKLKSSGKGLSKGSKTSKGRETVKLNLHATKAGRFSTKLKLTFTPSTGKDRRKQSKTLKVTFKK
jgi:hypothetical protein